MIDHDEKSNAQGAVTLDPEALERLRELADWDEEFLTQVINRFLFNTPKMLAGMRTALEAGNVPELHRLAHSLGSSSASFGALTLCNFCRTLEILVRDGTLSGADGLVAQIEAEYGRTKVAIADQRRAYATRELCPGIAPRRFDNHPISSQHL